MRSSPQPGTQRTLLIEVSAVSRSVACSIEMNHCGVVR
jgi:hypothetical protein